MKRQKFKPAVIVRNARYARFRVELLPQVCDDILDSSGDENYELHHSTKMGVAQGLAVWAALNTSISRYLPGNGPFNGDFAFANIVMVGSTIIVKLTKLEKKQLKCEITKQGEKKPFFTTTTKLAPVEVLARRAAKPKTSLATEVGEKQKTNRILESA